jgi:hypothetical protein
MMNAKLLRFLPEEEIEKLIQRNPVGGGMPGTTVGIAMNEGFAGSYSRNGDEIVEAKMVESGSTYNTTLVPNNVYFGDAVMLLSASPAFAAGTYVDIVAFCQASTPAMGSNGAITFAFAGFAVRQVKQQLTINAFGGATSANAQLGYYAPGNPCDVIVRGTVSAANYYAKSGNAAPVPNGPVFLRYSTNGAGTFVGALETQNDAGHTIQLTNCTWTTGLVDTVNGTIEVTITTRNIG